MKITATEEVWPLKGSFSISRGSKTSVHVVVATIKDGQATGVGEAVPYPRYNQDVEQTLATIQNLADQYANDLNRSLLREIHPPDAARNALDCALWDLEAKRTKLPAWKIAHLPEPEPTIGAYSLSLDSPEQLAQNAKAFSHFPLLKIKLGREQVVESVAAVRQVCPHTRIIVDANEAWDAKMLAQILPELCELKVEMIEQPLPADDDSGLEQMDCKIPLCADESFHSAEDLDRLANRYQIFNIKLDKTGGLTEAIELAKAVKQAGKEVMVGSMMATSLGLAPALLLAQQAAYVDLDSSVWLKKDRPHGIDFSDGILQPANPKLWG